MSDALHTAYLIHPPGECDQIQGLWHKGIRVEAATKRGSCRLFVVGIPRMERRRCFWATMPVPMPTELFSGGHFMGLDPKLLEAISDISPYVRYRAVVALGEVPQDAAVFALGALIAATKDVDRSVRVRAARTLGEIGPQAYEAVPALVEALNDEFHNIRCEAARALGEIGPQAVGAVPALVAALKDENDGVRLHAVIALGEIGPQAIDAVSALTEALSDGFHSVRSKAGDALRRIQSR